MARAFTRRFVHSVPERTSDGAGGSVATWQERGALWCDMRMRSGDLKETEFGRTPRLRVRITTHAVPQDHDARPWPGHRLSDGARTFVVDAVQESAGSGRFLNILATEVPGQEDAA